MSESLPETERYLTDLRTNLWRYDGPDLDFDGVLQKISLLKTQLEIQKILQATATSLRRHSGETSLPNQQASRVKHFIKFVFEKTDREKEK
jgi:hypothetical protein